MQDIEPNLLYRAEHLFLKSYTKPELKNVPYSLILYYIS